MGPAVPRVDWVWRLAFVGSVVAAAGAALLVSVFELDARNGLSKLRMPSLLLSTLSAVDSEFSHRSKTE